MKRAMLLLIMALGPIGCNVSSTRDRENYGDISNAQLSDPAQHPHGWGRRDCLLCHNVENNHRAPNSPVDGDAIAQMARASGPSVCLMCHGPNGVTP